MSNPEILKKADAFTQEVLQANRLNWEKSDLVPKTLFSEAAKYDLLSVETPLAYGGLGAKFSDKVAMAERVSRSSMAAIFAIINSQNIAARLSHDDARPEHLALAQEIMTGQRVGCTALTEPHAGSDFAAIKAEAKKVEGGWCLNGTKAWITNIANADVIAAYAQTNPELGWKGIACFLIDAKKQGFQRGEIYRLIGGHLIGAGEFHLQDYFVPDAHMLAPPGEAFKTAMNGINGARTYVAAMCAGMIADALEQAKLYGQERSAFGKPLLGHQGLNWSLVEVKTQLESLRLHVEQASALIDADQDAVLAAALAKKVAGQITVPAITACIQAIGAEGLKEERFLGQHLACAKIAAYTDGSTEMMNERIANYL